MTEIYLIRHAEAEGNLYRRIQGHFNSGITKKGYRQIEALKNRFESIHIDAVYSSDLKRTMETSRAVWEPRGLELTTSPEFREINLGCWENVPFGQLERDDPVQLDIFNARPLEFRAEGAELFSHVSQRMERQLRQVCLENPDRTIAVFSHGCAIRALLYGLFGKGDGNVDFAGHSDNTAVTHLFFNNDIFTLDYMNDNSHLDENTSTLMSQSWWKTGKSATDTNLWYEPLSQQDSELYVRFRQDAWQLIYGDLKGFDGSGFLIDARKTTEGEPDALALCHLGNAIVGLIQLNPAIQKDEGIGYIPFLYLAEKYRSMGLGVQLIGYAVSFYRQRGRRCLRLRVAPSNAHAIHFYEKYGFRQIARDHDFMGGTYIMEMTI